MTAPAKSMLSLSEYFGRAVTLYAEHFLVLVNLSFACIAPTIFKSLMDGEGGVSLIGIFLTPVVFCMYTFFLMSLTYMIASLAMEHPLTAGDAMKYVRTKFFKGLGGYLLLGLGVMAGLFLLILPGIYCFTVFYFFVFALLLEDKGVWDAFKRSDELVRPRFWKVLAAHGLVFLLTLVLLTPLVVGVRMLGFGDEITVVFLGVVAALILPVLIAFYYFIYAALKVEHDGVMNISVHT